jgi:hypothetical protein
MHPTDVPDDRWFSRQKPPGAWARLVPCETRDNLGRVASRQPYVTLRELCWQRTRHLEKFRGLKHMQQSQFRSHLEFYSPCYQLSRWVSFVTCSLD